MVNFYDKIDTSKLTRDYKKFPLQKKLVYVKRLKQKRWFLEDIPESDLRYLYLDCNLRQTDLQAYFGVSDSLIRPLLKKSKIKKPLEKIKQTNKETCLERYGDENFNNKEKYRQTCLKKYGKKSTNQVEEVKQKQAKTCLKRYGHTRASGNKQIQQKQKQTCLAVYGVENPMSLKQISQKATETKRFRYGQHYEKIVEKTKQTNFQKYESYSFFQSQKYKDLFKNESFVQKLNNKRRSTNLKRYGFSNASQSETIKAKMFLSKKRNGTLLVSKEENEIYSLLVQKFPDVKRQYRDQRYPFACDFYIPSQDLFIEYQGNWTHGGHAYNENSQQDKNLVSFWKQKVTSNKVKQKSYYEQALYVWTELDVRRRLTASKNNLNFLEFFNLGEFLSWFESL